MDRINGMIRVLGVVASLTLLVSGVTGVKLSTRSGEEATLWATPPSEKIAMNGFTHTVFMEDGAATW